MSDCESVVAWFEEYRAIYTGLARGERDDHDELSKYYADPTLLITPELYVAASNRDLLGLMRQQIDQLRQQRYDRTAADRLKITPLNSNAAIIDAHWTRLGPIP